MVWMTWALGCGEPLSDVCALAEAGGTCPACSGETFTCSFGDTSVTTTGCGGCETRLALFDTLCEAGDPASEAELDAGVVCTPVTCEIEYECSCAASCTRSDAEPTGICSPPVCDTIEPPPGDCVWIEADQDCGFTTAVR